MNIASGCNVTSDEGLRMDSKYIYILPGRGNAMLVRRLRVLCQMRRECDFSGRIEVGEGYVRVLMIAVTLPAATAPCLGFRKDYVQNFSLFCKNNPHIK